MMITCFLLVVLPLAAAAPAAASSPSSLSPCTTCKGPQWTWSTFPAFFHGSDPNGTAGGGFTDEALATITRFPIVTLEKWQGAAIEPYTWEEDAWVVAAKQIKARNPDITVIVWYVAIRARYFLMHRNTHTGSTYIHRTCILMKPSLNHATAIPHTHTSIHPHPHPHPHTHTDDVITESRNRNRRYDSVRIYQQNKTLDPGLKGGCTTGNFQPGAFLDSHPTPFLAMQADGVTPAHEGMGCHIHNQANRASQLYWQEMCLNMTRSGVVDGCGCDASWMDGAGQAASWNMTQSQGAAWGAGHQKMLRELSWPLLGDGVTLGKEAYEIGDYVSGALTEECTPSNTTINNLRQVASRAAQQGRRLIYECHWKPKDLDNMNGSTVLDSISAFLIGVNEHQYFGLGAWDNRLAYTGNPKFGGRNLSDHWVDGVFGRKLGAPLSDATYSSASKTWQRSFAGGTHVQFQLLNGSYGLGKIDWG